MTNPYFTPSGNPATRAPGLSTNMRSEFALVQAGFDKLPALTANALIVVNSAGTALTTSGTLGGTLTTGGAFTTTGAFNTTLAQQATVTLTLPLVNGTLATLAGTETLSNKTLTAPILTGITTLPGSGQISAAGLLGIGMTPVNPVDVTRNQNADTVASVKNTNGGASSNTRFLLDNGTSTGQMLHFGTGYTPSGIIRADGTLVTGTGAGGLTFNTLALQPIYVCINSVEVGRFTAAGFNNITVTSPATGATLTIADGKTLSYDEGNWTPADASGSGIVLQNIACSYAKIGRLVFAYGRFSIPINASAGLILISGLPYTVANTDYANNGTPVTALNGATTFALPAKNSTNFNLTNASVSTLAWNGVLQNTTVHFTMIYPVS